jgi:hypothetical protein
MIMVFMLSQSTNLHFPQTNISLGLFLYLLMPFLFTRTDLEVVQVASEQGGLFIGNPKSSLEIVQKDFCNLGDRMEVFDAKLHAAYEELQCIISRDICDLGYTYSCINNSSAIDVLADNPD